MPETASDPDQSVLNDLHVSANNGMCVHCLLQSGQPFLLGRPGMGAPEEVGCAVATGRTSNTAKEDKFWQAMRRTLKTLNGVQTRDVSEAVAYARCYAASINMSDVAVRLGGGQYMPLRKIRVGDTMTCDSPGRHHHQKVDLLLSHSGHWPDRVLSDRGLNPWMVVASLGRSLHGPDASAPVVAAAERLLPSIFAWTRALQGKTVLVVHPFNQSIVSQITKGSRALWGRYAELVMPPGIHFKVVAAPQNLARNEENNDWRDALATLIGRVEEAGHFDLAMISCGGLGMLLAAHLRATNRSSMYHGGELQLWFGIYGRRWYKIGSTMNMSTIQSWVRPAASEVPSGAMSVEHGTYW